MRCNFKFRTSHEYVASHAARAACSPVVINNCSTRFKKDCGDEIMYGRPATVSGSCVCAVQLIDLAL